MSREYGPTTAGYDTDRAANTAHLSVPQLATLLMEELPRECGLTVSATVYRFEAASPWIVDVHVHGIPAGDIDDPDRVREIIWRITEWMDVYNARNDWGVPRYVGPNVILLREFERHSPRPGRVSVRRYHLRGPWTRMRARFSRWMAGCVA